MLINENMQRLRKAAKLSQGELAQEMTDRGRGWHQNTVSRIELGKQELDSLGDVIALQEILGPELIEGTPLAQGMDVAARRSFYYKAKTELAKVEHSLRELSDAAVELSEVVESLRPDPAPQAMRPHELIKRAVEEDGASQAQKIMRDFQAELEKNGFQLKPAVSHGVDQET